MKTQEDVLSFEDITTYDNHLIDLVELCENEGSPTGSQIANFINEERPQLVERFVHTFLEWNLYDNYIYKTGWRISYKSEKWSTPCIGAITRVDTLEEAVLIAIKKVSRLLGKMVHLEAMKMSTVIAHPSPYDGFYKAIDGVGAYCGMVEIEAVGG